MGAFQQLHKPSTISRILYALSTLRAYKREDVALRATERVTWLHQRQPTSTPMASIDQDDSPYISYGRYVTAFWQLMHEDPGGGFPSQRDIQQLLGGRGSMSTLTEYRRELARDILGSVKGSLTWEILQRHGDTFKKFIGQVERDARSAAEADIQDAQADHEVAMTDLRTAHERAIAEKDQELSRLRDHNSTLQGRIDTALAEKTRLENAAERLKSDLESERRVAEAQIRSADHQIRTHRDAAQAYREQLTKVQQQLSDATKELAAERKNRMEDRENLEQALRGLSEALAAREKLKGELTAEHERVAQLQEQVASLQSENSRPWRRAVRLKG